MEINRWVRVIGDDERYWINRARCSFVVGAFVGFVIGVLTITYI